LSLLISHRVRFVLVGGHAVAAHGEPRLTEDLDVFVGPGLTNARRLRAALVEFGFGSLLPSVSELARPGRIWMLGRKPWRIDILSRIDGVAFARVWKGRVHARFHTGSLPIIGFTELITNKKAAARPKDLADVARLEALGLGRRRRSATKARRRKTRHR
jgi:hypothetical protein